ncbi:MAG TPA: hypothetical protein K8V56_03180 [Sporosarcina psychrophila]|uniref:Uncharacterized protein n=1 Tax=Sporosarcina psychrophila TaxID=1476 RepID=A0A921FW18_SPOPS|nr:hypothetical protein [Sporosarcina psychrophila]
MRKKKICATNFESTERIGTTDLIWGLWIVDRGRQQVETVVGPDKREVERTIREAISNYEKTGMYFEPSTITMATSWIIGIKNIRK